MSQEQNQKAKFERMKDELNAALDELSVRYGRESKAHESDTPEELRKWNLGYLRADYDIRMKCYDELLRTCGRTAVQTDSFWGPMEQWFRETKEELGI